jgi:hypothetical protein
MKKIAAVLFVLLASAFAQNNVSRYNYTPIATATNTSIAAKPTELHAITINGGTAGVVTVVDTLKSDCSGGTTIAVIAALGTGVTNETLTYDVLTQNGLCITTAAATNLTASWR